MLHLAVTNSQLADARGYRETRAAVRPRRIARTVVPALALVTLAFGGLAYASDPSSSLSITGPKSFKLGTTIELKTSGYAGKATFVVVHLNVTGACSKTAKAQQGKALRLGPFSANKPFSIPLPPLTPGNPPTSLGKHKICAFLTGLGTAKTYAYAGFSYTVHS